MISRRGFLGLAGGGAAAMGLFTPKANNQYRPIDPSPTPLENFKTPPATDSWPQIGSWKLPGDPNRILPTGQGRCLVGGEFEQDSRTTGYVAHIDGQGEASIHRFDDAAFQSEQISDLAIADDGIIALSTSGNAAHRLIRLSRDGQVRSMTQLHNRETKMWFPRLFTLPGRDELLIAGISVEAPSWQGIAAVYLASDGTPQWGRVYGYNFEPDTVRSTGQMVTATGDGYSQSGITAEVMGFDADGLRYHRYIPNRETYDIYSVSGSGEDTIVVGKTEEEGPSRGYVARLDGSGNPQWWRTLEFPNRSVGFGYIIPSEDRYRIQGTVQPKTDDDEQIYFELVIDANGEVQVTRALPAAVYGGQYGPETVFVVEWSEDPQLHQYRDMSHSKAGDSE